jgi:hypothetical protein
MSESNRRFSLTVLPGSFAMVRLAADAPLPSSATRSDFFSIARTRDELSIVCVAAQVPGGGAAETGWRALKVAGPFALSEIGVLAALSGRWPRRGERVRPVHGRYGLFAGQRKAATCCNCSTQGRRAPRRGERRCFLTGLSWRKEE